LVRQFEQVPYAFRPPRYNRALMPLFHQANSRIFLRKRYRVHRLDLHGAERVQEAFRRGVPILVAPNHPDHCDPHAMMEAGRRTGLPFHYMAARETFDARGGFNGWFMQRAGAFSVDRDGADRRSITTSIDILTSARAPLVIFPEGEIYHTNERLAPLNEGVATILLRVAAKRAKSGQTEALLVPTAIKYDHLEDVSRHFAPCLDRLERQISWEPQSELPIVDRIYKFGEALLAVKEREWLGHPIEGSLTERLERFRHGLLVPLEKKHGFPEGTAGVPERVKRLRNKIREAMFEDGVSAETLAELRKDLDRVFVAVQLYSYPGQYLRESPTPNRIAETIVKLHEDVLQAAPVLGKRAVSITFAEPVDMSDWLAAYAEDARRTVADVTATLETRIGEALTASG
jgi:1-acyl-sn-glycerol-3-phosphate acyltransferase